MKSSTTYLITGVLFLGVLIFYISKVGMPSGESKRAKSEDIQKTQSNEETFNDKKSESEVVIPTSDNQTSGSDQLEDYKILIGLVDTYLAEVKDHAHPNAPEVIKQVENKKTEYINQLNLISTEDSPENSARILKLNELREELLELIDELTMLKE